MKVSYYKETDTLYIELKEGSAAETKEVANGFVADLDQEGNIIGIEIDPVGEKVDLSNLETLIIEKQ